MKERQQRQGLVTPQPGQNSALPLVSPQPMQMGQITPQPQQQRPPPPPQQQQHQIPLNQPQAQRMMSNPQAQPQAQGQAGGIQEMIMKWTDQQLHTSAKAIVIKLSQPVVSHSVIAPPSDGEIFADLVRPPRIRQSSTSSR